MRGNERPSVAIRGHPRSSEAITWARPRVQNAHRQCAVSEAVSACNLDAISSKKAVRIRVSST
jgi:hypothetical protein